ncbi:hypothetical protein FRB96_008507 [Tulasnella sp. 330]|nr:hypothetical protein FRB96_008507 [Tulasnella sp. 330]KAG8877511.1 hypothetical protein FRB97_003374 [Tulasnella sp. 331]
MVVVLPANYEKAEPPPYSEAPESSPTLTPAISLATTPGPSRSSSKNYLRVVRINEDIRGHWEIDASSLPPVASAASSPGSSDSSVAPSVFFESQQKGIIDASMSWVDSSSGRTTSLPRVKVETVTDKGDISITTISRPDKLPLHIKSQARKRGKVKICLPPKFRGILALRYHPAVPDAARINYIALGASVRDQVACTRETAPSGKGKAKQAITGSQAVLVEFLIGPDLETADLNRGAESDIGALDLVEAEVNDGRIWIYSSEDVPYGDAAFEVGESNEHLEKHDSTRTWTWPGLVLGTGPISVSTENRNRDVASSATGVNIFIEEPKWLGYAKKKWVKLGQSVSALPMPTEKSDGAWAGTSWKGLMHPGATSSSVNLASTGRDQSRIIGGTVGSSAAPNPCGSVRRPVANPSPGQSSPSDSSPPSTMQLRLPASHVRYRSEEMPRSSLPADGPLRGSVVSPQLQRPRSRESAVEASAGVIPTFPTNGTDPIPQTMAIPPPPQTITLAPPPQHPHTIAAPLWSTALPAPSSRRSRSDRTFPAPSPAVRQIQRPTRRRSRSVSAQEVADWSPDGSPEIFRSRGRSEEQEYFEPLPMIGRDRRAFTTGHNPYIQNPLYPATVNSTFTPRSNISARLNNPRSQPGAPVRRDSGRLEQRGMIIPRAKSFSNLRDSGGQED